MSGAREVALAVLRDVFPADGAEGRGAQEAFDYRAGRASLSARDRAFATELAYGSIKMRRALDWYLAPFIDDRGKKLPPAILEVLHLGAFEFVYTKADEHATVFELVNLAKKYGHSGVARLTNAVLRSFLRDRPAPPERASFESDDDFLGTLHSLPTWLVRRIRAAFPNDVAAICEAVNLPAQASIVVNRLRANVDAVETTLRDGGVTVRRSPFVDEVLVAKGTAWLRAHERDARSAWWVQSESSAMPVAVLNPQPGEAVLDVASGRGNKALQSGARMSEDGTFDGSLLCVERDEKRAKVLQTRLEEGGIPAGVVVGDATAELLQPDQRFDRVLVDAPCTGVGVIGRHPEARWRKRPDDAERLAVTQLAMLERAASHVHEGGSLVYAVCSFDPHETHEVVDTFSRTHGFSRAPVPAAFASLLTDSGDVLVAPGVDGRDGFYVARLDRTS